MTYNLSNRLIDYSQSEPRVMIDGVTYTLHDGATLSLATPRTLSKLYKRLKALKKEPPKILCTKCWQWHDEYGDGYPRHIHRWRLR